MVRLDMGIYSAFTDPLLNGTIPFYRSLPRSAPILQGSRTCMFLACDTLSKPTFVRIEEVWVNRCGTVGNHNVLILSSSETRCG